jgi:2-(1,2-epoxy-1,2-dihydrophenyl)acetyl-CoA isomerase
LDLALADGTVRVLLLTGAGRGFCAGQDLTERKVEDGVKFDLGHSIEKYYNPLARKLLALPFPVLCAVNGVAAGAGANLALLCDLVIARNSAKFVQSFANIGLLPDTGGSWLLPHLIGQARAMGLALTGEPITGAQAAAWGLIWRAVEDDAFAAETEALAARLAKAPTQGLLATKRAIRNAFNISLDTQLDLERDQQYLLGLTADYREGVSAFKAKRPPDFRGR